MGERTTCLCGKPYVSLDGRFFSLGGLVVAFAIAQQLIPGPDLSHSRLFGAMLAAFTIMIGFLIAAIVVRLRQGHNIACSVWDGIRATVW
jgi:hypothetical protein